LFAALQREAAVQRLVVSHICVPKLALGLHNTHSKPSQLKGTEIPALRQQNLYKFTAARDSKDLPPTHSRPPCLFYNKFITRQVSTALKAR
jgi:hypothetical protein